MRIFFMNQLKVKILNISECMVHLETIVNWHKTEWGEAWSIQVKKAILSNKIPTTYVAIFNKIPVGTVLLVDMDLPTEVSLTPWLGGVYVDKNFRNSGIAKLLVLHAMSQFHKFGINKIWLYTENMENFYRKLGWKTFKYSTFQEKKITIMSFSTQLP